MRLLLVEDSDRLRETVALALRRSGYRIDAWGVNESEEQSRPSSRGRALQGGTTLLSPVIPLFASPPQSSRRISYRRQERRRSLTAQTVRRFHSRPDACNRLIIRSSCCYTPANPLMRWFRVHQFQP